MENNEKDLVYFLFRENKEDGCFELLSEVAFKPCGHVAVYCLCVEELPDSALFVGSLVCFTDSIAVQLFLGVLNRLTNDGNFLVLSLPLEVPFDE